MKCREPASGSRAHGGTAHAGAWPQTCNCSPGPPSLTGCRAAGCRSPRSRTRCSSPRRSCRPCPRACSRHRVARRPRPRRRCCSNRRCRHRPDHRGGARGHARHGAGVARAAAAVGVGGTAAALGLAGVLAEVTAPGLLVAVHRAALGRAAAGAALTGRSAARRQVDLATSIFAADVRAAVGIRLAVLTLDQTQLATTRAGVAGERAAVERLLAADTVGDAVVGTHHLLAAELGLALARAARRAVVTGRAGGLARAGLEAEATVAATRAARDVVGARGAELEAHAVVGAAQTERVADPTAALAARRAHRASGRTRAATGRVTRARARARGGADGGAERVDATRARRALGPRGGRRHRPAADTTTR